MLYDRAALERELIRDEGKRLTPYKDSLGYWTVGIGHLLQGTEKVAILKKGAISESECTALFEADIKAAMDVLDALCPKWTKLDDVRQRTLLNLAFNLGYRLAQFRNFWKAIEKNDFVAAAKALQESRWYGQVRSRGPRIVFAMEHGKPFPDDSPSR